MPPKKSAVSAKTQTKSKKPTIKATQSKASEMKAAASSSGTRNAKRKNEEPDSHRVAKSRKVKHDANGLPLSMKTKNLARAPVKTKAVKPKAVQSKAVQPKAVQPKAVQPKVVKPKAVKPKAVKPKVVLNQVPNERLIVYAFGSNELGELGLGDGRSPEGGVRPRLNPNLAGAVQIAIGGMHCAALTHDNKILTWGVNDLGALGRDTKWDGGWVDMKDTNVDDQDSDVGDVNPREATPIAVDPSFFPAGTKFVQLAAGDSATLALTDEGLVYGWGTFKAGDGKTRFSLGTEIQERPALVPVQKVIKIAAGNNHALALTEKGAVLAWGMGEQYQLGRKLVDRKKFNGLVPESFGLQKDIVDIASGAEHSFAVHKNGDVYAWGLNNYGQTGIAEKSGEDFDNVLQPSPVPSLQGIGTVIRVDGGSHHSVAVTDRGACLTWGRLETYGTGLDVENLPPQDVIRDIRDNPRILKVATQVPGIDAAFAAAGSDQCIVVSRDGKAYGWGFNDSGQTGHGPANEEVKQAALITHPGIRGKALVWAGLGGHFSFVAEKESSTTPNGGASS